MIKKLLNKWLKPNGISVLIAAQNEEKIITLCIESFLEFGDEIIIVTNGSTDTTRDICRKLVEKYPDKVLFYDKPDLPDLYYNRAYALSKAKYRWVFRGDGDYVAYTDEDGKYSIKSLRNRIIQTQAIWPVAFWLEQVNISYSLTLTRKKKAHSEIPNKLAQTYGEGFMPRVYLNTPLLKFVKDRENEGIKYQYLYKQIFIDKPYWFHLTLNSDRDLFLRSARREWRNQNDKYNTISEYIEKVHIPRYYPQKSFIEAQQEYVEKIIKRDLVQYDEQLYFKYPASIKRVIDGK